MKSLEENNFVVTEQNLQKINEYLVKQRQINRKRDIALGLSRLLSGLTFVVISCFLVFGLGSMSDKSMLDFPVFGNLWKTFCSYTNLLEAEWYFIVLGFILTLYLPPLIVFASTYILSKLILLLIRPAKNPFDELVGTECEKAKALVKNQNKAVSYLKGPVGVFASVEENYPYYVFAIGNAVIAAVCSLIIGIFTVENKFEGVVGGAFIFGGIGVALFFASIPYWALTFVSLHKRINEDCQKEIDKYWVANDLEEAQRRDEIWKKHNTNSTSSSDDSYISTMARIYAQEKKENDEYLKRLHEWATSDDDYTPGAGDGI